MHTHGGAARRAVTNLAATEAACTGGVAAQHPESTQLVTPVTTMAREGTRSVTAVGTAEGPRAHRTRRVMEDSPVPVAAEERMHSQQTEAAAIYKQTPAPKIETEAVECGVEKAVAETTAIEVVLHTEETYAETSTSEMTETRGEQAENSRPQQSAQIAEESDCTVGTGGTEARERGRGDDSENSARTDKSGSQVAAIGASSAMQSTCRKRPHTCGADTDSSHHDTGRGKDARRTGQRGHAREGAARHSTPVSIGAVDSEAACHADGDEDVTRPRMRTSLVRQQSL